MTFPELRKLNTPSVSMLNVGEKSTVKGVAVFQKLVLDIVNFFGGDWSKEQIKDCGEVCFNEWYYLTFAELKHFIHNVKSGGFKEHGKPVMYGSFVPATLIDWFCSYAAQNIKERENYFSNSRPPFVEPENPVSDETVNQVVNEVTEWFTELSKNDEEIERMERQEKMIKHQNMIKDKLTLHPEIIALKAKGMTTEEAIHHLLDIAP